MANIGATTAFYKVETSLTRANNEVSKSMERLATGKHCLLYTSPSPRDATLSRMPSSA